MSSCVPGLLDIVRLRLHAQAVFQAHFLFSKSPVLATKNYKTVVRRLQWTHTPTARVEEEIIEKMERKYLLQMFHDLSVAYGKIIVTSQ